MNFFFFFFQMFSFVLVALCATVAFAVEEAGIRAFSAIEDNRAAAVAKCKNISLIF